MTAVEVGLGGRVYGHLVAPDAGQWQLIPSTPAPGVAMSVLHPRTAEPWSGVPMRTWFRHHLPDAGLIRPIARKLGLSSGNELALLAHLGGDCPGAVTFRPVGSRVPDAGSYRLFQPAELRNLPATLREAPLLAGTDGMRCLLPGERYKLPVKMDHERMLLGLDGALSTHVLKIADEGLREHSTNEYFSMRLARCAGLEVPAVEIPAGLDHLLLVERIDRVVTSSGEVTMLHLEDFAQVWSADPECRYEREGGPGVAACVEILRRYSTSPVLDLRALLCWIIFGYFVGFGLGHARQLTLRHAPDGPRLGPFFGIWSSHVYSQMNGCLAMAIGRDDRPDWLIGARWRDLAHQVGVRPAYVLELLARFARELPESVEKVLDELPADRRGAGVLQDIRALVSKRARQTLVSLAAERG